MRTEYFECQCLCNEHVLRFVFDPDDGDLWTEVYIGRPPGFFRRIWRALKYIFNKTPKYGHFDCTLIKQKDIPRLIKLLEQAQQAGVVQLEEASDSNSEG